jgi:hypothetical protein
LKSERVIQKYSLQKMKRGGERLTYHTRKGGGESKQKRERERDETQPDEPPWDI